MAGLVLSPDLRHAIATAAFDATPGECCGLLVGRRHGPDLLVTAAPRARNLAPAGALDRYQLDPEELVAAETAAESAGQEVVGFYHSHPRGEPTMSALDRALAWPGFAYLIASPGSPHGGPHGSPHPSSVAIRAWYLDGRDRAVRELALRWAVGTALTRPGL